MHRNTSRFASTVALLLAAAPTPLSGQAAGGATHAGAAVDARDLHGLSWRAIGPVMFSGRISDVAGIPGNRDLLFVGSSSGGLYRSTNGGTTYDPIFEDGGTLSIGAIAVQADDPDVIYVGTGEGAVRNSISYGDGIYRTTDGGRTWKNLGLRDSERFSRIVIDPKSPRTVFAAAMGHAFGPNQERGVFRSRDGGATWEMVSDDPSLNNRPFYYTQVRADPVDPDRVYTLAGRFRVSTDGGRTFSGHGGSMFGDHHALWIDPLDPKRLYSGTDGGMWVSNDHGENWDFHNNMPLAQAYHVGIDMAEPYNVLGGFQDHEIWRGPNEKWNQVGVREGDWLRLRYMADGMYAVPDPRDPEIIYYNGHFGDITRIDMRDREERYIQPYPPGPNGGGAESELYRFNWNSPIHMSPTNPDVVYYGGNVLFRTTDGGESWSVLSPDLTRNDRSKQKPSGGLTRDNTRAEFHNTILSIAESPRDPRVIWVGTDDGNVQLTRDGGATWTNVAPAIAGAPAFSWVSSVHASHADAGTAYVSIDQHRLDDFRPYVFATTDQGRTWRKISDGLRGYVHVVMEDPREPGLLYAGTELGVFASFDRGASWTDLRLGLPPVSVVDIKVHPRDNDLVIATHARGFYILDDATPLQRLARARGSALTLFDPMPPVRYTPASDVSVIGDRVWRAPNQPYGAILSYWLGEAAAEQPVRVQVLARDGRLVRELSTTGRPGVNRVVWDLAESSLCGAPAAGAGDAGRGSWIRAVPGEYRVRLEAGGSTAESTVTVRPDPRIRSTPEGYAVWYREARRIEALDCMTHQATSRARTLDARLSELERGTPPAGVRRALAEVRRELGPVLLALASDRGVVVDADQVGIAGRASWLRIQVGNNSRRPTAAQTEWIGRFHDRARDLLQRLDRMEAESLTRLNAALRAAGSPEIRTLTPMELPEPAAEVSR